MCPASSSPGKNFKPIGIFHLPPTFYIRMDGICYPVRKMN